MVFLNIDVLCTGFVVTCDVDGAHMHRCTWSISNENRIGLVNGSAVSIHHLDNAARFCRTAFILRERRSDMVNRRYRSGYARSAQTVPA
ncbi:hypothetical protein H8B02_38895 [Bradyrhizobium sp. Pear77]|uniref:hypothetical protein n=1 Tax=Bradyrhizobium altum TaxID=1571202 RepID=UPI001E598155|nr:hypothetical protein [Bradyrhizobium altum]MCC8959162.1 hypothetical protein [Bradyrhizobium altum]